MDSPINRRCWRASVQLPESRVRVSNFGRKTLETDSKAGHRVDPHCALSLAPSPAFRLSSLEGPRCAQHAPCPALSLGARVVTACGGLLQNLRNETPGAPRLRTTACLVGEKTQEKTENHFNFGGKYFTIKG